MKRILRGLVPTTVALVGALALVLVSQTGALAAPTGTSPTGPLPAPAAPSWGALQRQALDAVSAFLGGAALRSPVDVGPIGTGTVTTPADGPVSVVQRTVVASGASGTVVLVLAWLGGRQLVVDEMSPSSGFSGETLVLAPGSSSVSGAYPIPRSAATAADLHGRSIRAHTAVLHASKSHKTSARLVTYAGCFPAPQDPGVIGSIYGPLVQGEGIIECAYAQTMAMIAGLYKWYTQVGTASGSQNGFYFALNVYYPCYGTTGTNAFTTTELWSIDGVLQPGTQSGWSYLNCG